MMNMIMKKRMDLKKKGKKGFTLIEVIVVIVIIAILAAIAVPALTGYIDKARNKAIEADARNIMVALQEIGADAYSHSVTLSTYTNAAATISIPGAATTIGAEITDLVGTTYTPTNIKSITYGAKNKLVSFTYTDGTMKVVMESGKLGGAVAGS
jgi:type IV pilus assembly protein PilA